MVPLAPDGLAVLAVVAGEARRPGFLAHHQLVDELDHRLAIGLVRELASGERHA